jgi:hypothetical protein
VFKTLKARFAVGTALVGGVAAPVLAAVPADVTTAISDMKADALTVAGAVLVAIIAVMAIKFIRRGM